MDLLSLSDPMVVVYLLIEGEFKEVGKTEVIFDTLDPQFSKTFLVNYNPDQSQIVSNGELTTLD